MPRVLWRPLGGGAVSYERGTPVPMGCRTSTAITHARVFEEVAKSHFLLKTVVFKGQKRVLTRFGVNLPLTRFGVNLLPETLWRGQRAGYQGIA